MSGLVPTILGAAREGSFWFPPEASTTTQYVDPVFFFILWVTGFFFVSIVAVGIYFALRYRKRTDADRTHPTGGSHAVEALLAFVPTVMLFAMFWFGFDAYMKLAVAPGDAIEIRVTGQKWFWEFEYPNGAKIITSKEEAERRQTDLDRETGLVVPVGKSVKLIGSSRDVLHSMFIPAFRVKKDVVPNRYTTLWFEATQEGTFDWFCAEYCGKDHSRMITKVIVKSQEDYDAFIAEEKKLSAAPADGKTLFARGGCAACHSLTADKGVGPGFLGLNGRTETLADGTTIVIDDNYLRESIVDPTKKVVNGFAPVMPAFAGTFEDVEIDALIDYLKSL